MKVRYLLIILFCIIIFLGCGGGGGSGVGPVLVSGQISGQITFDEKLAEERAVIASYSSLRASSFDSILVFLEEMPTRAVYADNDGKYVFTDLPLDSSFHVIARIKSLSGSEYKTRTEEIYLGKSKAHVTQNINIGSKDEAKYQIRLQVKDTKDNSVSRCKIWLWGEEFTIDESGCYLSPKMPLGASGLLKVIPPSNKDLLPLEWTIDSTSFQSEIQGVSAVTLPPSGITQKKAPYVSVKVGETISGGFAIRLYGNAIDPQNDTLELEWSTTVGSFTYESFDKSYVDWAIPTEQTTALITLKATQVSSPNYPLFWSKVELPITVSKNGDISYPGEIVVKPVMRTIDIISSATNQITGDTISAFEAVASFPKDLELVYSWNASLGSIVSGSDSKKMYWKSPSLKPNESKLATITAYVSDDIATISKDIVVSVTSFPIVTFTSPQTNEFYPGTISFRGSAKDYLGNFISYEDFKWYLATSSSELQLVQTEGASFTYDFEKHGSYTISLTAKDSAGAVGTGTMVISIINCPPEITILSPRDDGGYNSTKPLEFKAEVYDYEDGKITAPEQIKWFSDIDGEIGSGTNFVSNSLTKNKKHTIRVEAKDSEGEVSSLSVVIWYDMPAHISITPENKSVFFTGSKIDFLAKGIDANGDFLASSTYKWYLDGGTSPWKSGTESFSADDLPTGLHSVKVVGANSLGEVNSDISYFEVGWPLPEIISPASGTRFEPGTSITFTANTPSSGSMNLNWYIDESTDSAGKSDTLTKELSVGRHHIRYEGADSASNFFSSCIDIVVEREPEIELNYASGSFFFYNQNITFHAECKDSDDNSINDDNIKWYLLDSGSPAFWKAGGFFTISQGLTEDALAPGSHTARVVAVGPYGTVASKSFNFDSGVDLISIINPEIDNSYESNENITFKANVEKDNVPIAWYAEGELIYTGHSSFEHSFTEGVYTVKAIATDSANVTSSDYIIVNVGLVPSMDFWIKDINGAKVNPADTVVFTGYNLEFIGSCTSPIDGSEVSGSAMAWDFEGVSDRQSYTGSSELTVPSSTLLSLGEGSGTVELRCRISDSLVGVKRKRIYYNLPLATYNLPASDSFITFDGISSSIICSASGYPESVNSINYDWYLNWGKTGCRKLSDAEPSISGMQLELNKGENYLTLVATDSLGHVSAMTKKIIVDKRPELAFTPPSDLSNHDAFIFDGCDITLTAFGTNSVDLTPIRDDFKWYLGVDKVYKGSGETITNSELGLVPGVNIVTLTGEDKFGVVATITHNVNCGEPLPNILSPLEDESIQYRDITFEATGSENIAMQWVLNGTVLPETSNIISILKDNSLLISGDNEITYGGIDSAGNEKKAVLHFHYASADFLPKIEIKLSNEEPLNNAVLFICEDGDRISITGCATGSVGNDTIGPSKLLWTLYKDGESNSKQYTNTNSLSLDNAELTSPGLWHLSLKATDSLGFSDILETTFYYGYPVPEILLPGDKSLFTSSFGVTLTFSGSHTDSADLDMYWYNDNGDQLGSGHEIEKSFGRGYYGITYIGTDSAGVEKKDRIEFIVNGSPSLSIEYKKKDGSYSALGNESFFFKDFNLDLHGFAKKCDDTDIADIDVGWFKCNSATDAGISFVAGAKNVVLTDSMMGDGTWYLGFRAEDNEYSGHDFSESFVSSITRKITTGIDTPKFIGAVDGKRVDEGSNVVFTVNNISPINGYWRVNGGSPTQVTQVSGDNMCFTVNTSSLGRGVHTISYEGTDSSGTTYSAQTTILVDSGPRFTGNTPKIETAIDQIGTANIGGISYPIIKTSDNIINLKLTVQTNSTVNNTIAWHSLSGVHDTELSSFNRNFQIGSYSYLITITDEFGIATSTTLSFWVWGYDEYSSSYTTTPKSITSNGSSNVYIVSNNSKIVQFNRITDPSASTSGDLISSGSVSLGSNIIPGLFFFNSSLYSISGLSGGSGLTVQKWKVTDLTTESEDNISVSGSADKTGGFLFKDTKIYVSDYSAAESENKIKLYYDNDGRHYIDSAYSFKKPMGFACSDSKLFVADNTDNQIITLDLDGNDEECPVSVTSPKGVTFSSSTNRLYVAGGTGTIYVIDTSSYKVLYTFNVSGAYGLAICGTGETSDLYITDNSNSKILRLRSGYSW